MIACPLCQYWISDWEKQTGKTVVIAGKAVHLKCAAEHDISIAELEKKVRNDRA